MKENTKKVFCITGGTSGIGYQSALALAKTGASIVITGRRSEAGEQAKQEIIATTGNENVHFVQGDLSTIKGVDALAHSISTKVSQLDALINNAGYLGSEFSKNADNLEMHFAVNVLAPWRLSFNLLPKLKAAPGAKVLNITGGDKPSAIDPDNLQAEKGFRGLMTYTHSKSIMESMSVVLSERLKGDGVSVNILFPGRASTNMTSSLSLKSLPGVFKLMYPLFKLLFKEDGGKSAAKAARSTIWGATSPELSEVTGKYFDTNSKLQKLHKSAYDELVQNKIISLIESYS